METVDTYLVQYQQFQDTGSILHVRIAGSRYVSDENFELIHEVFFRTPRLKSAQAVNCVSDFGSLLLTAPSAEWGWLTERVSQAFTLPISAMLPSTGYLVKRLRVSVTLEVCVFIHKKTEDRLYAPYTRILRHIRLQSTAGCFKYCCDFSEEFTWEICSPFLCITTMHIVILFLS
jgi:hypothetical protein